MKDCFGLHGHSAFGSVANKEIGVGRKSVASVGLTTDLVYWLQAGKTVDISRVASESTDLLPPSALPRLLRSLRLYPPSRPAGCRLPAADGHRAAVVDCVYGGDGYSGKFNDLYTMAYISPDGKTYKDYQEYCNSDDLDNMEVFMKLKAGHRTPQNDEERQWLRNMEEMSKRGEVIDFPMGTF